MAFAETGPSVADSASFGDGVHRALVVQSTLAFRAYRKRNHLSCLQVCEMRGCVLPFVIHAVDVGDRDPGQVFFSDSLEATNVHTVHLAFVPDAKSSDATNLAEEMLVLSCIEPVLGQHAVACEEPEVLRFRYRRPEAVAPADGAIAAIRALREVEPRLKPHCAAVTASLIGLQHVDISVQTNIGVDRRPGGVCAKGTQAPGRPCRRTCQTSGARTLQRDYPFSLGLARKCHGDGLRVFPRPEEMLKFARPKLRL